MKKNEKEKIKQMAEKTGKSISELIRIALLGLEGDFPDAFEEMGTKEYVKGMNENAIWFFCSVCGKSINIEPNSEIHNEIINYMKNRIPSWVHPECLGKKT